MLEEQCYLSHDSSMENTTIMPGLEITDNGAKFHKKEHSRKGKKITLLGTRHSINNPADSTFGEIELEINLCNHDIILTQGFDSLYATKDETIMFSADVGICRYLAFKNGIKVNSWEPS